MCEEYGAPDAESDAWYTHAVVSLGYPKVKRGDKPMEGQESLPWSDPNSDPIGDIQAARRRAEEKYERDWGIVADRLDADEQRAREDERDQFRTDRPE